MVRCALIALVLALTPLLPGRDVVASTAPSCPVGSAETFACYPPSETGQVARLLPVRPIDPTPAVSAVTALPLTLVMTETRLLPRPGKHPFGISFVYGPAPLDGHIPYPPLPFWLFVSEYVGHVKGLKGTLWGRDDNGGQPGLWRVSANLPDHRLNVSIESNESRATIRCVALALLRQARRKALPSAWPVPSVECMLLPWTRRALGTTTL